jgi:hypothetical protein
MTSCARGGVHSGVQGGVAGRRAPSHALATIDANPRNAAWLRESLRDPATTCETDEWAMGDSNLQRIPRGILGSVRTVVQKATQLGPPYRYLTRSLRAESGISRFLGSQRHANG